MTSEDIDCNCNNCKFMVRDADKFKQSLKKHHQWSYGHFMTIRDKFKTKAEWHRVKNGDLNKFQNLHDEAKKMKYQFDKKKVAINYGHCDKLNKLVSFIPNVCQLDTQDCFVNRRH